MADKVKIESIVIKVGNDIIPISIDWAMEWRQILNDVLAGAETILVPTCASAGHTWRFDRPTTIPGVTYTITATGPATNKNAIEQIAIDNSPEAV